MSTILALETSSDACSVALSTPEGIVEDTVIAPREHTQRLLPMVESLLNKNNVQLNELAAIAYGAGPGSFTGLRICLSTAQGLAYGADVPLIAVSSLSALAATTLRHHRIATGALIVTAIDARMGEVYWCAYTVGEQRELTPFIEESISSPDVCATFVKSQTNTSIIAVGNGWQYSDLAEIVNSTTLDTFASAYDVALLGQQYYAQGQLFSPLAAEPVYLRNEVSWKKRERIRNNA